MPASFNAKICQTIYDKDESRELIRYSPYHPLASYHKPRYFPNDRPASFYEGLDAFSVTAVDVNFCSMKNQGIIV